MSGERIGVLCSLLPDAEAVVRDPAPLLAPEGRGDLGVGAPPLRPEWVDPEAGRAVWQALRAMGRDAVLLRCGGGLDLALRGAGVTVALVAARGPARADGAARGLLELLGIPYAGSDALTTALALDLRRQRQVLRQLNLPTPACYCVDAATLGPGGAPAPTWEALLQRHGGFGYPAVVRPRYDDPRAPPRLARDDAELWAALRGLSAAPCGGHGADELVIERHGAGRPVSVALLDGEVLGTAAPDGPPLSEARRRGVIELALRASAGLGCLGPVRVDLRVSEKENEQVLAVDPRPALAPEGLFGLLAQQRGLPFADLVARVLRGARLHGRSVMIADRAAGALSL